MMRCFSLAVDNLFAILIILIWNGEERDFTLTITDSANRKRKKSDVHKTLTPGATFAVPAQSCSSLTAVNSGVSNLLRSVQGQELVNLVPTTSGTDSRVVLGNISNTFNACTSDINLLDFQEDLITSEKDGSDNSIEFLDEIIEYKPKKLKFCDPDEQENGISFIQSITRRDPMAAIKIVSPLKNVAVSAVAALTENSSVFDSIAAKVAQPAVLVPSLPNENCGSASGQIQLNKSASMQKISNSATSAVAKNNANLRLLIDNLGIWHSSLESKMGQLVDEMTTITQAINQLKDAFTKLVQN